MIKKIVFITLIVLIIFVCLKYRVLVVNIRNNSTENSEINFTTTIDGRQEKNLIRYSSISGKKLSYWKIVDKGTVPLVINVDNEVLYDSTITISSNSTLNLSYRFSKERFIKDSFMTSNKSYYHYIDTISRKLPVVDIILLETLFIDEQ